MLPVFELTRRRRARRPSGEDRLETTRLHESHHQSHRHIKHQKDSHPGAASQHKPSPDQTCQVWNRERGSKRSGIANRAENHDDFQSEMLRISRQSKILQRYSKHNLQGEALQARNRLDERLRAAAVRTGANTRPTYMSCNALDSGYGHHEDVEVELSMRDWVASESSFFAAPWQTHQRQNGRSLGRIAIHALLKGRTKKGGNQKGNKSNNDIPEQSECSICLEPLSDIEMPLSLPCKHKFHGICIRPWLQSHTQCPYCRAHVSDTFIREPLYDNKNFINGYHTLSI